MNGSGVDLRAVAAAGPVHFMGAGGAGMCALAELLVRGGGQVSGCDVREGSALRDLRALGAEVHVGHDEAHVEGASALVVTAAVPPYHPEVLAAHERGIPVLKRAQALAAIVEGGKVIAIAGTHGKTTTTAMATEALAAAGLDPTGFVGGRVPGWAGNLRYGSDALYVVEADEYDRSFHTLHPDLAVVTNVEADHLDIYGDVSGVHEGFATFLAGRRNGAPVIVCADDAGAAALLGLVGEAGYTYGTSADSALRAIDVEVGPDSTRFRAIERGEDAGALRLRVGGLHNVRNALAAAAVARHLGAGWAEIREGLEGFGGVSRRFELLGSAGGVDVLDDYAHHPTELRATLEAARARFPGRRLVAAFQPHLYSRTRDFVSEFGEALASADVVWVTDVFAAREAPIPGVDGAMVADAARARGGAEVHYHADVDTLGTALADAAEPGDLLLTLGAGSIESVGRAVLAELEARGDA